MVPLPCCVRLRSAMSNNAFILGAYKVLFPVLFPASTHLLFPLSHRHLVTHPILSSRDFSTASFPNQHIPRYFFIVLQESLVAQMLTPVSLPNPHFTVPLTVHTRHSETEFKLGHVGYYENNRSMEKQTVDSLFVLKRGREGKYKHTVVNARMAGML